MSGHFIVVAFLWVVAAIGVAMHAMDHDRSPFFWGILTILTGLIGLAVYIVVIGTQLDDSDRDENVVVCPNCSARHTESPSYCSDCGEPLDREDETSTASIVRSGSNAYCGNCNARVGFETDECPSCGSVF